MDGDPCSLQQGHMVILSYPDGDPLRAFFLHVLILSVGGILLLASVGTPDPVERGPPPV